MRNNKMRQHFGIGFGTLLLYLTLTLSFSFGTQISFAQQTKLSDIHVGLLSYVPLQYFLEHRLIEGYPDNTFRPDDPVTRAEALVLIKKAVIDFNEEGMPLKKDTLPETPIQQRFSDVPTDYWAAKAIEYATEQKIIHGYENGKFMPNKIINLAEALKMIVLAEKQKNQKIQLEEKPTNLFADVKTEDWFSPFASEAKKRGLLRFGFKNTIEPNQTLTRGYFVDLVFRLLKSRDPNRFFGKATFYSDSFEGKGTSSGEKYTQNGFTAAHKTLPFNTNIRVTNLKNGQHIDVRINDRGPFNTSLDVDLTSTAFSKIASTSEGIVPVMYEILQTTDK